MWSAVVLSLAALHSSASDPYVLFMGNSITYSRGGVDTALMAISEMMGDSIVADREVRGSSEVIDIWNDRNVLTKVQANGYSHVILQPYVGDLGSVQNFARSCDTIFPRIQATGARVVLYFSWPFESSVSTWDSVAIGAYYDSVAAEHDLDVVPVGPSFIWWYSNTGVRMYDDHVHPSPMAQYLAGSFFYTYLMQQPPSGSTAASEYELNSLQARKMHEQASATLLSSRVSERSVVPASKRPVTARVGIPYTFDMLGRFVPNLGASGLHVTVDGVGMSLRQ